MSNVRPKKVTYGCGNEQQSRPVCPHCYDTESGQQLRLEMLDYFKRNDGFVTFQSLII